MRTLVLVALPLVTIVATSSARADDAALQLWLDHAVASSDHVVRGKYEGGRLEPTAELRGTLRAKPVAVERDEVELKDEDLVPRTPHMKGAGVFFLEKRFDPRGEDPRRFLEWQGAQGVAWEGTATFLGYRPADEDRLALVDLAAKADFEKLLQAALERAKALDAALALVESKSRAEALAALVRSAHEGEHAELGPDPFAARALTEIGHLGGVDLLDALRREAKLAWVKPAAIRALAASAAGEKRLEALALDEKASEDEVVAAVDMIFSSEKTDLSVLEKLSFDARARVRRAVAAALREKVGDLGTLERLMKDPDASVRGAATASARAAARRLGLPMPEEK